MKVDINKHFFFFLRINFLKLWTKGFELSSSKYQKCFCLIAKPPSFCEFKNVTNSIVILSSVTRMNREMDCGSVRSKTREVIVTRCVNSCRPQFLTVYVFIDVIVDVNSRE